MTNLLQDYAMVMMRDMGLNPDGTEKTSGAEGMCALCINFASIIVCCYELLSHLATDLCCCYPLRSFLRLRISIHIKLCVVHLASESVFNYLLIIILRSCW